MKSLFRLVCLLLCGGFTLAAQAQTRPAPRGRVEPKSRAAAPTVPGNKDGAMLKEGRVLFTEMGQTNPLLADRTLTNGTKISPTGLVTLADGTSSQLLEGDYVSLSGRVTTHAEIAAQDSITKIKMYDLKFPGKRERMAKEAERKQKAKEKADEEKAKRKKK